MAADLWVRGHRASQPCVRPSPARSSGSTYDARAVRGAPPVSTDLVRSGHGLPCFRLIRPAPAVRHTRTVATPS